MNKVVKHVDENPKELQPVLKEFKQMVEDDSRLYMLFNAMFEQVSGLQLHVGSCIGFTD
jgi:phosphatidylserine decarboxylase